MKILKNREKISSLLNQIRNNGQKIGLIPTMGSIHEGHLSLLNRSIIENCYSVVSIFVNPTQFNDLEDFKNYPKSEQEDIEKLSKGGCNAIYFPLTEQLYPHDVKSKKTIFDYRNILCDVHRPGHFDGVTTVVNSLFEHVKPDVVFFGEKDFQQLKLIKKVIESLNLSIEVKNCPSIRLKNGMSLSSRYNNFSLIEKNIFNLVSIEIKKCVINLKKNIDLNHIIKLRQEMLKYKIDKIDYLEIRNDNNLKLTEKISRARLFVAFYIGKTRIIDNFILY